MTVAQGLVNRLEREGFIRAPAKGKKSVPMATRSVYMCYYFNAAYQTLPNGHSDIIFYGWPTILHG